MSTTTTATETTVQEKLAKIKEQRMQSKVDRQLAMLDDTNYVDYVLAKEDSQLLDKVIADISQAYDAPTYSGFTYHENIEKLVAICSKLQFAKATQRESISADYYDMFDRAVRDMVVENYGQLPYLREVTKVELSDGSIVELDADIAIRAKLGTKPNVQRLQTAIDILSNTLGLQADYRVTTTEAERAWSIAKDKINKVERLQAIAQDYKQSI